MAAIVAADEVIFRRTGAGLSESQIAVALRMIGGVLADNVPSWDSGPMIYAACFAALSGHKLHVMAVDDTDARNRAAGIVGPLGLVGLTVRVLEPNPHGEDKVATAESRGETYAADVVVGTPERFALDYLVDNMASLPSELMGHEFDWAFLSEADFFLLDQAFERVWVDAEGTTLSRIRVHEYLRLYPTMCGVTPVEMSETDRDELRRLYGLEVIGSDKAITDTEASAVSHPYHDGRLSILARRATELCNRGRRVVAGVSNPDHLHGLAAALTREGTRFVVVGEDPQPEEPSSKASELPNVVQLVTAATCRTLRLEPSFDPDQRLAVLVAGRSVNRRDDARFKACAADAGGRIRFFVANTDELTASLASPMVQRLESLLFRLLRRDNGVNAGGFEARYTLDRQIQMSTRMAEYRIGRQAVDAIEEGQRLQVYRRREEWLSADDPMPLVKEVIRNFVGAVLEDRPEAEEALSRLASAIAPSVSIMQLKEIDRGSWAAVLLNEIETGLQSQLDEYGAPVMDEVARQVALSVIDKEWREHLAALDQLIGTYYRKSPGGGASTAILRAGAAAQADRMWRNIRTRTIAYLLSLEHDASGS